jgi:hypothetical protein
VWQSFVKVALATTAFGIIHSALTSHAVKEQVARLAGQRQRNGLYRLFFVIQSLVTLAGLITYVRRLPDRILYRIPGRFAWLMVLGQATGPVYALFAARQVGIPRLLGIATFTAWLGRAAERPEPEAQGPVIGVDGRMRATGPFAWSRHPLNLAPLPILWLSPAMTIKLLAFNLVATLYFIVGSRHEEARLRATYGSAYTDYLKSGVPFYLPRVRLELRKESASAG